MFELKGSYEKSHLIFLAGVGQGFVPQVNLFNFIFIFNFGFFLWPITTKIFFSAYWNLFYTLRGQMRHMLCNAQNILILQHGLQQSGLNGKKHNESNSNLGHRQRSKWLIKLKSSIRRTNYHATYRLIVLMFLFFILNQIFSYSRKLFFLWKFSNLLLLIIFQSLFC